MISGALRSINLFNLLFLLITLLYKSFRSLVANLPPSRGTKGRSSGGITGTVERLIDNDKVEVEIAENVKVEIVKSTGIQSLVNTNTQEVKK